MSQEQAENLPKTEALHEDEHAPSYWETHEPSNRFYLLNVALMIAGILLFLGVMLFFFVPTNPGPINQFYIAERQQQQEQLDAEQRQTMQSYAVLDAEKGVVQVPVDRAMQIVVDTFEEGSPRTDGRAPWQTPESLKTQPAPATAPAADANAEGEG